MFLVIVLVGLLQYYCALNLMYQVLQIIPASKASCIICKKVNIPLSSVMLVGGML